MQVCTEINPRIPFEDFKFFAFTFLAIIVLGTRHQKINLGALGAMVSLERSAKKVTVTQATNKTTWEKKETWTSSEMKTKTNPDQKPTNCESHRSLNSPEKQKRPVPTPVARKERDKNQICKRASTNTCKRAKTSNLSEFKNIHQTYKQKNWNLKLFFAKKDHQQVRSPCFFPMISLRILKKKCFFTLLSDLCSHTWRL